MRDSRMKGSEVAEGFRVDCDYNYGNQTKEPI